MCYTLLYFTAVYGVIRNAEATLVMLMYHGLLVQILHKMCFLSDDCFLWRPEFLKNITRLLPSR